MNDQNEITDEDLALRIRGKLLRRLEHVTDHAPEGLVTEVQYKRDGMSYKLTDLVASYKNVVGKMTVGDDPDELSDEFSDIDLDD